MRTIKYKQKHHRKTYKHKKQGVLLIGSSITMRSMQPNGFGYLLQQSNYDIHLMGGNGFTTQDVLEHFSKQIQQIPIKTIQTVVLFVGNNDSNFATKASLRSSSTSFNFAEQSNTNTHKKYIIQFEQNMKYILYNIKKYIPHANIILITPTKYNENLMCEKNRKKYVQIVKKIAKQEKYPLVDLWSGSHKILPKTDLIDGKHLNDSGNRKVWKAISKFIK